MAGSHTRTSLIAVLACAGTVAACGGASGVEKPPHALPSTGAATHSAKDSPRGEHLVLRMRRTGGIVGLGGGLPDFSLYSTGRALVAAREKVTEYRLKPAALDRLLDEARAAGLGRSHTVSAGQVADANVLEFTMGGAHTKIVLPESQSDPGVRFQARLDPARWPAADLASGARPYAPSKVAVLASEGAVADGPVRTWPLAPLGRGTTLPGAVCTLAAPAKVPATNPGTAWRSGGKTYTVRLRPLLPDEHTCTDLRPR